jgi:hypothetical protein
MPNLQPLRPDHSSEALLVKAGFAADRQADVDGRAGIWYERVLTQA